MGKELEHRANQAQAGPQNGHGDDPIADRVTLCLLERRVNREVPGPEIAGGLVEQQRDDLVRGLAKLVRRRLPVAQARQLVDNERMLDDVERHDTPSLTLPRTREMGVGMSLGGSVARPGAAMRPSASSFLTRAMLESDQLLSGRRGVNRAA